MAKKAIARKSARKAPRKSSRKQGVKAATGRRAPTTRRAAKNTRGVAAAAVDAIQGWPTDPMAGVPPLRFPIPTLPGTPLATRIIAPATAPNAIVHAPETDGFRYWTAAEALRRCAAFWTAAGAKGWHPDVGASIPVRLDDGVELNAYYARTDYPPYNAKQGLSFFHDTVRVAADGREVTVFSGESPDVVAHELGHAVLDTLKPELFELASVEAAAFHESFGDMSAILTALQLPTVRKAVLEETGGELRRNSSVSRVAAQLGFAIRQRKPASVDPDCLRNAANAFRYVDPLTLPASGPASGLTRAGHNFARVFTGGFLEALGGMVTRLAARPRVDDVEQASLDMGQILARAVTEAPVSTEFFHSVAEQMVLADRSLFNGKYADALTTTFAGRGLMPAGAPAAAAAAGAGPTRGAAVRTTRGAMRAAALAKVAIDGAALGLPVSAVYVEAPPVGEVSAPRRTTRARGAAPAAPAGPRMADVHAFMETLMVRGRLSVAPATARRRGLAATPPQAHAHPTHYLARRADDAMELRRVAFECC